MPERVTPEQIAKMARARGLDPDAVLAVARQEGLGGGVGDAGTSFGPFQLHYGGAYPSSAPHGQDASQAWAWSPSGVAYALRQIAGVAGGMRGRQAVENIVRRFERPADPGSEIRGALAAYGHGGGGAAAPPVSRATPEVGPAQPARVAPDLRRQLAFALLQQVGQRNPDYSNVLSLLQQEHAAPPPTSIGGSVSADPRRTQVREGADSRPPTHGASITGQTRGLDPGFEANLERAVAAAGGTRIRVDSGYRSPEHNAAVGGVSHSNHLTGHAVDGAALVNGEWVPLGILLRSSAKRFGLRSGDQPGFYRGGRDTVHVDDASNMRRR